MHNFRHFSPVLWHYRRHVIYRRILYIIMQHYCPLNYGQLSSQKTIVYDDEAAPWHTTLLEEGCMPRVREPLKTWMHIRLGQQRLISPNNYTYVSVFPFVIWRSICPIYLSHSRLERESFMTIGNSLLPKKIESLVISLSQKNNVLHIYGLSIFSDFTATNEKIILERLNKVSGKSYVIRSIHLRQVVVAAWAKVTFVEGFISVRSLPSHEA